MIYQIWMEGYAATGEHGTAQMIGEFEADSFDEAVELYSTTRSEKELKEYGPRKSSTGYWTIWGCRLFDNEEDARKSFG